MGTEFRVAERGVRSWRSESDTKATSVQNKKRNMCSWDKQVDVPIAVAVLSDWHCPPLWVAVLVHSNCEGEEKRPSLTNSAFYLPGEPAYDDNEQKIL